eukprot:177176-Pyramimonas_sp.AAC.1
MRQRPAWFGLGSGSDRGYVGTEGRVIMPPMPPPACVLESSECGAWTKSRRSTSSSECAETLNP